MKKFTNRMIVGKIDLRGLIMNKFVLLMVVIIFCSLLTGCVFFQRIIIINESDRPIMLEYNFKNIDEISNPSSRSPEIVSVKELDAWFGEENWKPMPKDRIEIIESENSNKFILKINPKEAVTIEQEDKFYIRNDKEKALDIKELKIIDKEKEIYYKSDKILFEEFEQNDFKIRYK